MKNKKNFVYCTNTAELDFGNRKHTNTLEGSM